MTRKSQLTLLIALGCLAAGGGGAAPAFEGRIQAVATRNGSSENLLYTVSTNAVRIEVADTNNIDAVNLLDRSSGVLTLLLPRIHCYLSLQPKSATAQPPPLASLAPVPVPLPAPAPMPAPLNLPPGVGPRVQPGASVGGPAMPGMPAMPAMPQRPLPPSLPSMAAISADAPLELRATGRTTNLLGYDCKQYVVQQWAQTMEIWATDQLTPFQAYLQTPPMRYGAPSIERRWTDLLAPKGLFPLLASLRMDNGPERYRFEVQSVTAAKLTDEEAKCFQMPDGYTQVPSHQF